MIGKKCILTEYGLTGIIQKELQATKTFPASWGIYWYGITEAFIKEKGLPNYWQDKSAITIKVKL